MIINTNMNALNAHRNMGVNNAQAGKSMEKLSSGLRINRAGDDAAGLAISEKMRGQIRGLDQASRNSQDGISMIQTAEGALNETHNIVQRMRELAVQAGNDTNTGGDRVEIQKEIEQLTAEVDRIANNTEFNTQKLLNGNKSGIATVAVVGTDAAAVAAGKTTSDVKTSGTPAEFNVKFTAAEMLTGAKITVDGQEVELTNGTTDALVNLQANKALSEKYEITAGAAGEFIFTQIEPSLNNIPLVASLEKAAAAGTGTAPTTTVTTPGTDNVLYTTAEVGVPAKEGKAYLQVGANKGQNITVEIEDMRAEALKIRTTDGKSLDVSDHTKANAAVEAFDKALNTVSAERSKLGAVQNRLEYTTSNLNNTSENLTAAESRIRDVDMAKEMLNFSKNNILNQAAQSMLAQAKSQPEGVLQLLR